MWIVKTVLAIYLFRSVRTIVLCLQKEATLPCFVCACVFRFVCWYCYISCFRLFYFLVLLCFVFCVFKTCVIVWLFPYASLWITIMYDCKIIAYIWLVLMTHRHIVTNQRLMNALNTHAQKHTHNHLTANNKRDFNCFIKWMYFSKIVFIAVNC